MSPNKNSAVQHGHTDSEAWSPAQLSQALRDLARGEQASNALENNLSKLESKLDELLASFEDSIEEAAEGKDSGGASKSEHVSRGQHDDANALEKEKD